MMERLTNKKEADAQRIDYETRLKNGYPRNIPEERFLRLAAYEDIGLTPEEIKDLIYRFEKFRVVHAVLCDSTGQPICEPMRMKELADADKDGRLVMLSEVDDTPAADVAPVRHGKWLKAIDNDCEMHKCSRCGARVVKELYEDENPNRFCYHCGARMDGGDDNA